MCVYACVYVRAYVRVHACVCVCMLASACVCVCARDSPDTRHRASRRSECSSRHTAPAQQVFGCVHALERIEGGMREQGQGLAGGAGAHRGGKGRAQEAAATGQRGNGCREGGKRGDQPERERVSLGKQVKGEAARTSPKQVKGGETSQGCGSKPRVGLLAPAPETQQLQSRLPSAMHPWPWAGWVRQVLD